MAAVGVHLGSTCACVAIYKDGRADVIANDAGDRVTPAMVAFRDSEKIVGLAAKQGRIRNATTTVVGVKRILGHRFEDDVVQKYISSSSCPVIEKDGYPVFSINNGTVKKHITRHEVATLILQKMKETALFAVGADAKDAVITTPLNFTEQQVDEIRQAAESAGFNVLRILSEPAAALLAFGIGQENSHSKCKVLVYKLGGTCADATAVEVNSGLYRVLGSVSDDTVGGEEFTDALAEYLAAEFQKFHRQDLRGNSRAMMKLHTHAEMAKHVLSTMAISNCFVDSLHDGLDFECNITRARFDSLCSALFQQSLQPIHDLLTQINLTASDFQKVVLCGGSARIPKLQQLLQEQFVGSELMCSIPVDEVIALGAAAEAGILLGRDAVRFDPEALSIECASLDILVKEQDEAGQDCYTVVFPVGTPLPARRQHVFQAPGTLPSVLVDVYEGVAKGSSFEGEHLAQLVLKDLQQQENGLRDISTVFTMKRDGSLLITCTDQLSGTSETVTVEAAS
ncbi:heat shock 70 kDa protein 14 [Lethenteron reissneri]|uniref:heat shock 70 kDa protein 14 n=1 Tax=Lethenteron reissneri TaxID=7753 RepID=UPI002AB5DECA|nr:heat shock 70 kDa protein 14 [Lethenteron reissneri]